MIRCGTLLSLFLLLGCEVLQNRPQGAPNVRGQVMSKSDVQSVPDAPLQALVVAIPRSSLGPLMEEVGRGDDTANYNRLTLEVSEPLLNEYSAGRSHAEEGTYALQLEAGNYYLCLANIQRSQQEQFPARIRGCVEVVVPEREQIEQDLYWGMAGVTAQ